MTTPRLERSCAADLPTAAAGDRIADEPAGHGLARARARLHREAHARHRHDRYILSVTEAGVQAFGYRGSTHRSRPGQVVVLHPDEAHDGRPGSDEALVYRSLYLDPVAVHEAARALTGRRAALPFVAAPVLSDPRLARVVVDAFTAPLDAIEADALIVAATEGLLAHAACAVAGAARTHVDVAALARVADYLAAHCTELVRAPALEALSGLSRYELCAQFKRRYGTSPHRYLLMRRLDAVKTRIARGDALAEAALTSGFADQAHMTRQFKAAFGFTPKRFAGMVAATRPQE